MAELAEERRRLFDVLAHELEARSLKWQLAGTDDSVLCVVNPATRRQTMVVATLSGDGWCYLWTGGGTLGTAEPGRAAELIARMLS